MGKSAKFYKRPTKKEKESLAQVPKSESTTINKKAATEKKSIVNQAAAAISMRMDIDDTPKKPTKAEPAKPDYVDLLSGKKTYKRFVNKKKK
ncbi:hypothetical protein BC941DRAFT_421272 [Chlamydoabsidia padenii]|nr:hypothetical protein BC941DRAFT_421272 [Chlamydoabsidia padenii]